jgi:hypothetical protein
MTLSISAIEIMTLLIMTLSITMFSITTLQHYSFQQSNTQYYGPYCTLSIIAILDVFALNASMLSVITSSIVMLGVILYDIFYNLSVTLAKV